MNRSSFNFSSFSILIIEQITVQGRSIIMVLRGITVFTIVCLAVALSEQSPPPCCKERELPGSLWYGQTSSRDDQGDQSFQQKAKEIGQLAENGQTEDDQGMGNHPLGALENAYEPGRSYLNSLLGSDLRLYTLSYYTFVLFLGTTALTFLLKELNMGICTTTGNLEGKSAVVTGGSTGIGLQVATLLAARGAAVVIGCRDRDRGISAVKMIKALTGNNNVRYCSLDLISGESVTKFCHKLTGFVDRVDILVNNAGVVSVPKHDCWCIEFDSVHPVIQTNYLGHFLLTLHLLLTLKKPDQIMKIINLTDEHSHRYGTLTPKTVDFNADTDVTAYSNSKLALAYFTEELVKKFGDTGLHAYSVDPGFVRTDRLVGSASSFKVRVMKLYGLIAGKNPWQGAQTVIHCATSEGLDNGGFYADCRRVSHFFT